MALFEKETRYGLLGVGVGAGAALAAPYVGAVLGAIARPLAKALITQGIDGFEKASETVARAAESLQDVVAEVQAHRTQQHAAHQHSQVAIPRPPAGPDPRSN